VAEAEVAFEDGSRLRLEHRGEYPVVTLQMPDGVEFPFVIDEGLWQAFAAAFRERAEAAEDKR
jgi:hypothetical protein